MDELQNKLSQSTLIYVADPLCSWCYGFSTEIKKVREELPQLPFQLVMGGLRPFNDQKIDSMKDFLKGHWEHVAQRSGVPFNFNILSDPSFIYDTEPPCRATVTTRLLAPELEMHMFHLIQRAFYFENKHTDQLSTYKELLPQLGIDETEFEEAFESKSIKDLTLADFKLSRSLGVQGFPSTILKTEDQMTVMSRGFMNADLLIDQITDGLNTEGMFVNG